MATGNTAMSPLVSSAALPAVGRSPSNVSSPLSDVEDKDADPGDMELDAENQISSSLSNDNLEDEEVASAGQSRSASEHDEDSNLSEVDINDSEAETERLYDTPPKNDNIHEAPRNGSESRSRQFEPSPSKLKQQLHAHAEKYTGGDESLSGDGDDDEREGGRDDNISEASSISAPSPHIAEVRRRQSPSAGQSVQSTSAEGNIISALDQAPSISDSRKRKRSPVVDQYESDQPLPKRTGSVGKTDATVVDEKGHGIRENPIDSDHSEAEEGGQAYKPQRTGDTEMSQTRKSKRHDASKGGQSDDGRDDDQPNETGGDVGTAGPTEVDHADADVDEEAEAAHRNEEELEKKKVALGQLHAIERHFAAFRDRLYEERLAQLNEEEAMLTGDNPTHPEYLAMMQCIDARRDEKLRVIGLEHDFNLQTLRRWAVARRGQIHGQFFQSIRESREVALDDLGKQWYHIQQQRRRHANTIPDYGIRFPASRTQRTRDAVAYNKEVSVLSGVAKYEGFPAAPQIRGASAVEIEDDFEEISRARQGPSHQQGAVPASFQELSGLSFSLGAAGQQYLADTPWANPNHPSHHVQRQQQELRINSPLSGPLGKRLSHTPTAVFSSSTGLMPATPRNAANGDTALAKAHPTIGHEKTRTLHVEPEPKLKPEAVVHPS